MTLSILGACFVTFSIELALDATGGDAALEALFETFGVVPADVSGALAGSQPLGAVLVSLITYQFLHGGWLHLGGNMLYLWIFGNNVEDRLGPGGFVLFFLAGGIVAALTQVAIDPTSDTPLVGASGAIAAILGAYFILFPGARVLSIVFLVVVFQFVEVPAVIVLGLWFALQLIDALAAFGVNEAVGGVAIFAHIGGFLLGVLVGLALRRARARPQQA